MSTGQRLILNAFQASTPGQHTSGGWRNPRSEAHKYTTIDYWVELARILEKGKFDACFLADSLGINDVYQNSAEPSIRAAVQVPVDDPAFLIPAMAAETSKLGFALTSSLTYENPYILARKFTTLDHLTNGRIGLNAVTSYSESAARNLGLDQQLDHDLRYDRADEFLEVCYKLWEGSWEDNAVVFDQAGGVYADPKKVHPIEHHGRFFSVPGRHISEPSIQRTPVIYQAGASRRGQRFAARNGEGIFINAVSPRIASRMTTALRDAAEAVGRKRSELKILQQFTVIVADSDAAAERELREVTQYCSAEGAMALWGGFTGLDLSTFAPDEPLKYVQTNAIQSIVSMLTELDESRVWTPTDIVQFLQVGGMGPVIVGSPETVVDELQHWQEVGGIDGVNLQYTVSPGSYEDFVELVVPELQKRKLMWDDYEGDTLREYFYGQGNTAVLPTHPAFQYQRSTSAVSA